MHEKSQRCDGARGVHIIGQGIAIEEMDLEADDEDDEKDRRDRVNRKKAENEGQLSRNRLQNLG